MNKMNKIKCDVCHKTIGYTNRVISQKTGEYLFSDKLSNNQKFSLMQRAKLIYCEKCYNAGIKKAMEEIKIEMS